MITFCRVRRFRSMLDLRADLAPLTILVGPNGSGKSNFLLAIERASQLARAVLADIVMRTESDDQSTLASAGVPQRSLAIPFAAPWELYGYTSKSDVSIRLQISTGERTAYVEFRHARHPSPSAQTSCHTWGSNPLRALQALAGARLLSVDRLFNRSVSGPASSPISSVFDSGWPVVSLLEKVAQVPDRAEKFAELGRSLFGADWTPLLDDPASFKFVERAVGPSGVELPLGVSSLGTWQCFSILLNTIAMEPNDILMVEEPEISLHPRSQVALGEHFAEIAAKGRQLLVSTHSHYLLLGVCRRVRAGDIDPEQVVVLNFFKYNYGTRCVSRAVNSEGVIEGWIPSFAEVDEDLFRAWATD